MFQTFQSFSQTFHSSFHVECAVCALRFTCVIGDKKKNRITHFDRFRTFQMSKMHDLRDLSGTRIHFEKNPNKTGFSQTSFLFSRFCTDFLKN